MGTQQLLLHLPDDLVRRLRRAVAPRQRSKFIQDLLEQALPPDGVAEADPLYLAALDVENDETLAAEMGGWDSTMRRYYTPSGRSIQATGIVPDIAVANGDEATDFVKLERPSEADLPHHLIAEQTASAQRANVIRPPAGNKVQDFQLSYAVKVLSGKPPAGRKLAASH